MHRNLLLGADIESWGSYAGGSLRSSHFAWLVFLCMFVFPDWAAAQFPAAPGTGPGLAETVEAIDSARITTRILYITAHPDDESAAVLTYLARGLHADVALLSLTRGEGGQNALGPEQAPQLGLIRTQELLAATRGYGVKLYFTRARDFGFSKTPEESQKIWGDQVVEDMVRIIRAFRPNIVINNWGGVHSGHGHHQAAGILTPQAVALAADPGRYPQMAHEWTPDGSATPWNGGGTEIQILDLERGSAHPKGYVLPLDNVSPLYGKSWRQIGLDAFVNHHTQGIAGFLNSPFLQRPIALLREDGKPFDPATLAISFKDWTQQVAERTCVAGKGGLCRALQASDADEKIVDARKAALALDWRTASADLAQASTMVRTAVPRSTELLSWEGSLTPDQLFTFWRTEHHLDRALALAAGLQLTATADTNNVVPGQRLTIQARSKCRREVDCQLGQIALGSLDYPDAPGLKETSRQKDSPEETNFTAELLPTARPEELFAADMPETPVFASVNETVAISGYHLAAAEPVTYIAATSTSVVRVPLRVVPAYTVAVEPAQMVEVLNAEHQPFDIFLRVHSYSTQPGKIVAGLDVPDGLLASPPVELSFTGVGDQYAKLTVTPPGNLDAGDFTVTAYAKRGEEKFSTSLEPLASMPTLLWSEPSQCVVHAFDIHVPSGLRVAYISAEGEPIPDALRRLGISVEALDTAALTFGHLSKFDAIVVGVRAYELRPELAEANKRLLDYVANGGTLVVQYNRDNVWDKLQPAPYPAKIGNPTPRITYENSPVEFLQPDDPLLNHPNKITQADFQNWIQERGLYFWSDFDSRYTPLLAMNDPGEKDLTGGLVYTHWGKGTYIYTGLAFFRELPEGVPGAYRLFVNLISASKLQTPAINN
jgi:LmbE family N-acetylglucosaminyl deacetylase